MALVGEIHVVPSGKVYRQIFDAEVQLVRCLVEARNRGAQYGTSLDTGDVSAPGQEGTRTAGLLSHRQRLWVDSMPYDCCTENPVLYRKKLKLAIQKLRENEDTMAAREVRGLCDLNVTEKKESGVLQRITTNRHERHHAAVSDLNKELAEISKKTETLVLEAGKRLQEQILASDTKVNLLFQQIEEGQYNRTFTLKDLNEIWEQIAKESHCRRSWIKDTEMSLIELEEKRAEWIAEVLKKFTLLLTEICYLMPSDVYRLIHKEAMMINQAILANHRAIAKLSVNLMETDLKWKGTQRLRWQDLVKAWKHFQKETIIQEFRAFAEDQLSQMPARLEQDLKIKRSRHKSVNRKQLQLLCSVSNFVPPSCTKTDVTDWYASLTTLNTEADSFSTQLLDGFRCLQEDICQHCRRKSEQCKEQLINLNICHKEEAEYMVASELSSLIEQFQIKYNKERELWDESLKAVSKQMHFQIKKLFEFSKQAVHLWDVLEIGLARLENTRQKKMDICRQKYKEENQANEANLDIILDKLRQESTPEMLHNTMGKALMLIQDIKSGYQRFYQDQVSIVDTYPATVMTELLAYSTSVSKYFGVKEIYGQVTKSEKSSHADIKQITSPVILLKDGAISTAILQDIPPGKITTEGLPQGFKPVDDKEIKLLDSKAEDKEPQPQKFKGGNTEVPLFLTEQPGTKQVPQDNIREPVSEPKAENPLQGTENTGQPPEGTSLLDESPSVPEALEMFTTRRGNTYTVQYSALQDDKVSFTEQSEAKEVFMTEVTVEDDNNSLDLSVITIAEDVFTDLMQKIRLGFYEHLERWFDESVSNTHGIVAAKKEELEAELKLYYHLHKPRSKRIEMNIHNVRAAELLLHTERVDRHCEGVNKSLSHLKKESGLLIENMRQRTQDFRSQIYAMETIFLNANKSDQLVALNNSLSSILDRHVSGVQTAMRQHRQHVEEMLGKLCDTNSDFIRSFRLFSEGGNFSPAEVETYRKKLHKSSSIIGSFEGSIIVDLEGLESVCLEQATEVVKKFEDKFVMLTTDMIFLENIQKLLTNLQVKIKALVLNSNGQNQQINTYLDQLQKKTDACAHPNMDKETVTSEELYSFAKTVMEEVARRGLYLSCLLEPGPVNLETPLQGPIAAASRLETPLRHDGRVGFGTPDNLLNPSRIGKLAVEDVAVSVIKSIMRLVHRSQHGQEDIGNSQTAPAVLRQNPAMIPHPPSRPSSDTSSKRKGNKTDLEATTPKLPSNNVRKLVKLTRFDKKYQVFGEKKEESNDFMGLINDILWESNDILLHMAEEFYKKRDRRSIGRRDLLQDTFEECADVLVLKLQTYEKQALEYSNYCLLEFRDQLGQFEQLLSHIPPLVIETLLRQHLEGMQSSTDQLRQLFSKDLNKWELIKKEKKSLLRPSLGHPENCQALEDLCRQEELRQQEEREKLDGYAKNLQDSVSACTEGFIATLASLTEKMLLELDNALTVDDVIQAKTEKPKETLSTLIRRKQAGLPLEKTEYQPMIERGSRVWMGISHVKPKDTKHVGTTSQSTASVTTAKTTLSHLSTVEARDSAYQRFLQAAEIQLNNIQEESKQQHLDAQRWREWWDQSILHINKLYL
ncbi:coiled-coil domain-containing protein 180 [Pelodytes ibericus]